MTDQSSGYSQVLKATNGTDTVYYTRGFELISRHEGDASSFYLYDGGLSVRALTDITGAITDTLVFDAFGNETEKTGTTANTYGFQGEEKDATGLYYLRARYMDPVSGTFTSMDTYAGSLSDPMSLHKYLFANSNPVMYSDPSGHETTLLECVEVCAIIGMLAGESLYLINCFVNDEKVTSGGVLLSAVIGGIVAIAIFFIVYAIVKLILIIITYFYVRPDQASSFSDNVKEVTENAIEKANSFILRKNMVSAGIEVPDYRNAAHHIVAGAAQKAQEARDVLSSFGIRINDSINGVFLPIVRDVSNAAYHPEIHTKIYYETVNQLLNDCNTKEDVISVLKYIADALSKNEFPY